MIAIVLGAWSQVRSPRITGRAVTTDPVGTGFVRTPARARAVRSSPESAVAKRYPKHVMVCRPQIEVEASRGTLPQILLIDTGSVCTRVTGVAQGTNTCSDTCFHCSEINRFGTRSVEASGRQRGLIVRNMFAENEIERPPAPVDVVFRHVQS
ncbi:hypothetical protein A6409_01760 [Prescottella equi]|nr:hypothetical protein A6409_01760 [Prescottella equi]